MKNRSIKLTFATLALAMSAGFAQAATYTATSTAADTFVGLATPTAGFTNIMTGYGFTSVGPANGLSINRRYAFSDAEIYEGTFIDKVSRYRGTTYSFATNVVGFFGSFNMNPLNEDTQQNNAYTFVNDLRFTFYSGNTRVGSYDLVGPTSNAGMEFDFGLRSDSGSFDRFVVRSLGNGAGNPQETFSVSNFQFAAAVPEPETYAMLLAGLCAIGFMSRRRRPIG
jgi:hypothetical protein